MQLLLMVRCWVGSGQPLMLGAQAINLLISQCDKCNGTMCPNAQSGPGCELR